jgi:hypothetical protein
MSIPVTIQAKTAAILERDALFYGVNATAVCKAILDTVAREGLTHQILAGIDVESFHNRKRGRPASRIGKQV